MPRHKDTERLMTPVMQLLAQTIHGSIPVGWGFALLVFELDKSDEKGTLLYVSDAERQCMLKAMVEFICENLDEAETTPEQVLEWINEFTGRA